MTEKKLGTKYECPSCSVKYYDFGRQEPTCPKCGIPYHQGKEEAKAATKAKATKVKSKVEKPAKAEATKTKAEEPASGEEEE